MPLVDVNEMVLCPMEKRMIYVNDCANLCDHFNGINEWNQVVCGYENIDNSV